MLSSIDEDHYLRLLINNNDLKLLLGHFVNFLLNIGIIRPMEEGTNSDIFMVSFIISFLFISNFYLLFTGLRNLLWCLVLYLLLALWWIYWIMKFDCTDGSTVSMDLSGCNNPNSSNESCSKYSHAGSFVTDGEDARRPRREDEMPP